MCRRTPVSAYTRQPENRYAKATGNPMENGSRMMQIHCILDQLSSPSSLVIVLYWLRFQKIIPHPASGPSTTLSLETKTKAFHAMSENTICIYIYIHMMIYNIWKLYIYIHIFKTCNKYEIVKYFDGNWCKPLQCQAFKKKTAFDILHQREVSPDLWAQSS